MEGLQALLARIEDVQDDELEKSRGRGRSPKGSDSGRSHSPKGKGPRSPSPEWQVRGRRKGKGLPKDNDKGKGKGSELGPAGSLKSGVRKVGFATPNPEQSETQTFERNLLAQLKALILECENSGTDGILTKVRRLAQAFPAEGTQQPKPRAQAEVAVPKRPKKPAGGPRGGSGSATLALDSRWWPGALLTQSFRQET